MFRLFGDGGESLPDNRLESSLTGVFASEFGKFAVHRTPKVISSFSWRATDEHQVAMGITLPLDQDVLCYPMPWNYVGRVQESGEPANLRMLSHRLMKRQDGFAVNIAVGWCSNKVRQDCAFVSLPDGRSVYLEERYAEADIQVELAISGSITLFDDTRWIYQKRPRLFTGQEGELKPDTKVLQPGNWVNVDDRLGFLVLGINRLRLSNVPGIPRIWRENGTMYDTCRLEFVSVSGAAENPTPRSFKKGERISRFGMITCPGQSGETTAVMANRLEQDGWHVAKEGVLALALDHYLVYSNFSLEARTLAFEGQTLHLAPKGSGWVVRRP
jgi:hypothetical protein